jgi:hypothetical protein
MNTLAVFGTQLVMSLIVFSMLAKWCVSPWLSTKPLKTALMILIAPHALRHIGLTFLVPSVVDPSLPSSFALTAAYGDFISGLLAIIAIVAIRRDWAGAIPLTWLFSIVGTLDLMNALSQAEAVPSLAATWYIPTFFVPILLVTHVMIFLGLIKNQSH